MQQLYSFVRKEFYHVFRDSKTLLMLFGLPIAQILLFGFALTNEIKNANIVVCDYANDNVSNELITQIAHSNNFTLAKIIHTQTEIEAAFEEGDIKLVLVFPNNFAQDLYHQGEAAVQIIADASDPNTATTLTAYAQNIIRDYQQQIQRSAPQVLSIIPQVRMLYNPELKGATNFVPGLIALVMLLICVLMTSVSIVREKEMGTMEILLVSPTNPLVVIIAKALPYFFLSLLNLTIVLLMSVWLLGISINGSLLLLYFVSSIFILCALSLGLLISNIAASQQAAMLISLMGMLLPTVMFSGFMFPIENMPVPLQIVSNIVPSKWFYIIVKDIMIKGTGFAAIWKEVLILSFMTLFLLAVSFKKFKIRLS
ncbi:MAG: ABC transporter permease [Chitinophagales bacterium]|nr:ABC transporter permease [Bacteroidota bacterium]MCB9044090.1 ABC transporter permease [Chitinophagales bacterium]